VDYLKYDNCNLPAGDNIQTDNVNMKNALAASGRAIVFSICDWNFQSWMPGTGNLWRTTGDINDSWGSMYAIPNTNNASASSAGPGAWNDPDMLEVGRGGMTDTEYRTHFGWWAIMAAPLIAGNDTRSQTAATSAILEAPEIIAVDQDPAGHQGTRVWDGGNGLNIWSKTQSGTNTRAVFVVNGGSATANITVSWSQIGLPAGNATVRDLWSQTDLGTFTSYTVSNIPSHGSRMFKIVSTGGGSLTSYESEAGTRSGAAVIAACSTCSGGNKVGYIGNGAANYLTNTVNVSTAGSKTLTIYYIVSGTRPLFVSVNGGAGTQLNLSGTDWTTPHSTTMTVSLNAGNNTIKFYNDTAYGPDLDRITIQ
jgi:alpha-galactosidase